MSRFDFLHNDRFAGGHLHGKRARSRRRGVMFIAALVCLAVAVVVFVLLAKQAAMEHKVIDANRRNMQAAWLAEAGVERAAYRLAGDPKYAGETWTVSAMDLATDNGGVVKITVKPFAYQPKSNSRYSICVEADFPDASQYRCRVVKQITVSDREKLRSK